MDYLNGNKINFEKVDVLEDEAASRKLEAVSNQTKTPTLDWNGEVLSDFGVEELEEFLKGRVAA